MRAVLFDLGDTLIVPAGPWDPVMARACLVLSETLCQRGILVDCDSFAPEFASALRGYYAHRETSLEEPTTFRLLHDLLAAKGFPAKDADVRAALDALYTITRSNWRAAEGAQPALSALSGGGLRLGLLSNAGDDEDVRILAREAGVSPFLDFIVTSAQVGFRKPDLRTFQAALAHWDFAPGEIMMVGDRLDADVAGGQRAGLVTTWITPNPVQLTPGAAQPDFTISSLRQLPALIAGL
jgi:HAD superfamily hydrolase (TIGR01549 family)